MDPSQEQVQRIGSENLFRASGISAAKDLIHVVIVQGGATRDAVISQDQARRVAELTLENFSLQPDKMGQLEPMPYGDLLAVGRQIFKQIEERSSTNRARWTPSVDRNLISVNSVYEGWEQHANDILKPCLSAPGG